MDEYINREEAVKKIKSSITTENDAWEIGYNTAMAEIMEWIEHIPAADVQPVKHGRWVCVEAEPEEVWCDNCKTTYRSSDLLNIGADDEKVNFCPNCGARMV